MLTLLQLQHLQGSEAHTDTLLQHMTHINQHKSAFTLLCTRLESARQRRKNFYKSMTSWKCSRQGNSILWSTYSQKWWMTSLCAILSKSVAQHMQVPKSRVQATSLHQVDVPEGVPIPEFPPKRTKLTPSQVQALKGTCWLHQWQWKRRNNKNVTQEETIPRYQRERAHLSAVNSHNKSLRSQGASLPLLAQQYAIIAESNLSKRYSTSSA